MTLAQWHEKYWPVIEASVRPSTERGYDVGWRLRVRPSLGKRRLDEITSTMIETVMVGWDGGPSVKNDALAVLSRLLDGARRDRIIDYIPAKDIKRPSTRESKSPRSRALTVDQVRRMLHLVPDGPYRRFLAVMCFTGMRAGAVTALRAGDVDFARGVIRISRSMSPGRHGELVEQTPKSHKDREAPLSGLLRPYAEAAALGRRPDDLLFSGPDGGRLTNHNLRRAVNWATLREALGRPDLRIHDLRHTFATILFDSGAAAPDVQATLGHSNLQVTERYSTAREGVAIRAGSVIDAAFGEGPKAGSGAGPSSRSARSGSGRARLAEPTRDGTSRPKNGTRMAQLSDWEGGSGTDPRKTPDPPRL